MAIKTVLSAAGTGVVPVLGAAGPRHAVERGPVAGLPAGESPAGNTPWT
ncbi:hypothetical protein [Streptomyces kronopolitis]